MFLIYKSYSPSYIREEPSGWLVIAAKTCAWKNVPKIENEGAHGTTAFDDARGHVVRGMIDVD